MKSRRKLMSDKVPQEMTPMIDVVFQLLAFFVMSFKVASVEGDFNIKMPLSAPSAGPPTDLLPPIRVRLTAGPDGTLSSIGLGDRSVGKDFKVLHREILALVGTDRGPGSMAESAEVELDCDYGLHYANVIKAITAISGYVDSNDHVVKLIEKIKFSPPRKG